jgi:hypothetical protein
MEPTFSSQQNVLHAVQCFLAEEQFGMQAISAFYF